MKIYKIPVTAMVQIWTRTEGTINIKAKSKKAALAIAQEMDKDKVAPAGIDLDNLNLASTQENFELDDIADKINSGEFEIEVIADVDDIKEIK